LAFSANSFQSWINLIFFDTGRAETIAQLTSRFIRLELKGKLMGNYAGLGVCVAQEKAL